MIANKRKDQEEECNKSGGDSLLSIESIENIRELAGSTRIECTTIRNVNSCIELAS